MAKPSWVITNPPSGSGNATVAVSSNAEYTGREAREGWLTFKAVNVENVERKVTQAGKPEYVDIADAASADQAGKNVTISGTSNSKKLTFALGTGDLDVTLPSSYTANSVNTLNGADISGDPGASTSYTFYITIYVPANTSTSAKSKQIIVTDEAGHQDVCTLTSAAGDAYLNVQMGEIKLGYEGRAVNVTVESNTDWTVE